MKVGIIIGAGASAAINPKRIPLMDNFFKVVADFAKRDAQVAKTLSILQKYRLVNKGGVPERNLEDVLTDTLSLPRNQKDPWERPYDSLLLTLHHIFHLLDRHEDITGYVDCLSPLRKLDPKDITFISFNYDIFLERALENLFSWCADFGYSNNVLAGYINAEQAEQVQSPKQICDEVYAWPWDTPPQVSYPSKLTSPIQQGHGPIVLKPHGSLNWFIHSRGKGAFWMSNKTHRLLLMRPINGKARIPSFWIYPTTNTVHGELADPSFKVGAVLPAIIPPGKKFSKNIPPFRRIERSMKDVLSKVSRLVVIGWSMRRSDKKYRDLFETVTNMRKGKLDVVAVISFHQKEEFYSRFISRVPTKRFLRCNEGFLTKQAKRLLARVIEPNLV